MAVGSTLTIQFGSTEATLMMPCRSSTNAANLGAKYRVKEYPEELSFSDALAQLLTNQQQPLSKATVLGMFSSQQPNPAKTDALTEQFLKFKDQLKSLEDFNDPLGVYARMPLGWEIK